MNNEIKRHSKLTPKGTPPNQRRKYPRPPYRGHPSQYYDAATKTWHQPR